MLFAADDRAECEGGEMKVMVVLPLHDSVVHIVQRHLIPGLLTEHGLTAAQLKFPSESISLIADGYTREVGLQPSASL